DVGNPWLDAGIVGFSTLKYNQDRAYWRKWYPADFITESFPGQFRNWFYALLALSTMMGDGEPPFKTLLGHGLVRDQFGHEIDPTYPKQQVPAAERPDIDRWILSCLQVLVQTARESTEKYDLMTFALAAERFVDEDLSNWYVRRVKPRLNSKVADLDAAA